ncbi:tyrosine-type recombinase/integrase [Butyrivibrio sp. INlla16]|uniref:tyrosine-type recombinase/integrase n=1 Tax=Butyrivibrio sp. INlla16 TaxID=1520807 RepID=UPI00088F81E8|nr:tyrosine-type recombinase/integrase [Butyrivibrio sp. INlla16]SDB51623.1 Site-specific recombinase XerC [Butyrivibrio sp. INlla16]
MGKRKNKYDPNKILLRDNEGYRSSKKLYTYRYTDPFGKRRTIYAKTLKELRRAEEYLVRDRVDGIKTYLSDEVVVNDIFARYMATKYGLSDRTMIGYQYFYDHFVKNKLGSKKVTSIGYSDIKIFYVELLEKNKLTVNTVSNIQCVLRPAFQMAVRDGLIRLNPCDNIMREVTQAAGAEKGKRHALTREQQRAFMDFVAEHPVYSHWTPLFTVMFGTGMRIGEVSGLRWDDVDYKKRVVNVRQTVYYGLGKDGSSDFHLTDPKSDAGFRKIPMLTGVREAFQEEYEFQKSSDSFNRTKVDGVDGFVFRSRFGSPITQGNLNKTISRITEEYNALEIVNAERENREPVIIPHFTCHVIRHTFCTRLCEKENNLKAIQYIMGHADIQTTMNIYAEATKESTAEAMAKLDDDDDII